MQLMHRIYRQCKGVLIGLVIGIARVTFQGWYGRGKIYVQRAVQ